MGSSKYRLQLVSTWEWRWFSKSEFQKKNISIVLGLVLCPIGYPPLVRRFISPKVHWSEGSLVRRFISPKVHWSEGSLVRRFTSPKVHWSEGSQVRKIKKVHKSEGSLVRKFERFTGPKVHKSENQKRLICPKNGNNIFCSARI